jgi:hypothetical protein
MLSSEYFLLYGPAADVLGKKGTIPAPPTSIMALRLPSGVVAYVDRFSDDLIKAYYQGKEIKSVGYTIGPNEEPKGADLSSLTRAHHSFNFLKARVSGADANPLATFDLIPKYKFSWQLPHGFVTDAARGAPEMFESLDLHDKYGRKSIEHNFKQLPEEDRKVDVSGLKPEARVVLSSVFPRFPEYAEGKDFSKQVTSVANEIGKRNPAMAKAIRTLLPQAEEEARKKFYGPFNSRDFLGAMLTNLSFTVNQFGAPAMWQATMHSRLAHLVASAVAELELRRRADAGDGEAKKRVGELEALQKCEENIF